MAKRVVVGISGGVDSSVAAYLLKQQGYDVVGLFMINWHDTTGTLRGDCPWEEDQIFAQLVARKLNIPFHSVDFSKDYRERIVDYMFSEYENGRTPNPDVLCNREVKFDLFLKAALELDADFIATGHYCRKEVIDVNGTETYRLLAGIDPSKEQSYFLCQLNQQQLEKALFPIGHLYKSEIREIAAREGLATAERKDSQGLCFIGKVDLPSFLQQKLSPKPGEVIEVPKDSPLFFDQKQLDYSTPPTNSLLAEVSAPLKLTRNAGIVAGNHNGAHYYTIGQRKGLNIGGRPEPLFVLQIDTDENLVFVGQGHDHPALNRQALFIPTKDVHWIRPDLEIPENTPVEFDCRIRYRQPLQKAKLFKTGNGTYIYFQVPQRGIAPGQFAAWYKEDELVGSGVIS